jgi:hypothetical protein
MKRQNHRMAVNTADQWPTEELTEKKDILHESTDHRDIGKHIPSIAREKVGFASEHYHRAVAQMAYELWEKRGHPLGSANTDWANAEAALKPLWSANLPFAPEDSGSNNSGKL